MMDQALPAEFLPNKMGRILLMALEEVIGNAGVNAVLNQARLSDRIENYPPATPDRSVNYSEVSAIQLALEQIYGPRGGRGVALRSGRVCFRYGLREFSSQPVSNHAEIRLAPMDTKIKKGAQVLSDFFRSYAGLEIGIESSADQWLWKIKRCPICWERQTDSPACHLMVGIIQEGLYWISGGKFFDVEETSCIARNDPDCTFRIDKHILE